MLRNLRRTHRAGKTVVVVMPNEGVLVVSNNRASVGFADHHPVYLAALLALALHLAQMRGGSLLGSSLGLQCPLPFLTNARAILLRAGLAGLPRRSGCAAPLFRGS